MIDVRRFQLLSVAFSLGVVIIGAALLSNGPAFFVILPTLLFCATVWLGAAQPRAAVAVAVAAESGVVAGFLLSLPVYGLFNRGENNLWPVVLLVTIVLGSLSAFAGSGVSILMRRWRHHTEGNHARP